MEPRESVSVPVSWSLDLDSDSVESGGMGTTVTFSVVVIRSSVVVKSSAKIAHLQNTLCDGGRTRIRFITQIQHTFRFTRHRSSATHGSNNPSQVLSAVFDGHVHKVCMIACVCVD